MRPILAPFVAAALLFAACHAAPAVAPDAAGAWPPAQWSAGDAYAPELGNRGYEVSHYALYIALDPAQKDFHGTATLSVRATLADLSWLSLDLSGLAVDSVRVDGKTVEHTRLGSKLFVRLPALCAAGKSFTVDIAYGGAPVTDGSRYVPFFSHLGMQYAEGVAYVISEPDGARCWFPCNDHPTDKATFHIEVAVPAGLTGVANGVLRDTRRGVPDALGPGLPGDVFVWDMRQPMATYLATAVAGNLVQVEGSSPKGVKLRHFVPARMAERYAALNPKIGEAVDWMADQFGAYPYDAFGYVVVPGFPGGLETQSLVIMGSSMATDEEVLVHELVHQWFGDWVTPASWQDMWFNEGFAVYWSADAWPARASGVVSGKVDLAAWPSAHALGHPPCRQLFGHVTYQKGAAFVQALRLEMGEDAFAKGLRAFMTQYGGATFTRSEFQQAMEAAAGRPLTAFFAAWLDQAASDSGLQSKDSPKE